MRGLVAAIVVLVAFAGAGLAAGYDDLTRGLNALVRDDPKEALAAFNAAIAAGDLVPANMRAAYRGRASAYLKLSKCPEAAADLDTYVALHGAEKDITAGRLGAALCLKDVKTAKAAYRQGVAMDPTSHNLWNFSRLEWQFGIFSDGADSAAQALKIADSTDRFKPYYLLWYTLNAARAGTLDATYLAAQRAALKLDAWPAPLFDLFLGKASSIQILSAAAAGNDANGNRCEADFYTAEWLLIQGDKENAQKRLQLAADNCPHNFMEKKTAEYELYNLSKKESTP